MKPNKGEFIKAIALTAIMLALLAAMVPSGSAVSKGDNFNHIDGGVTDTVLVGQNVKFEGAGWTTPANVIVEKLETGVWYYYAGPWTNGEAYNVPWDPALILRANEPGVATTSLSVQNPIIPLTLKVGEKAVLSIAVGTPLKIDTGGINLFDEDKVHLVIMSQDGQLKSFNNQIFTNITVAALKEYGSTDISKQINTTGWKIGDYTFQVNTKWSEYACGLSGESVPRGLTIKSGKIDISAEKTTVIELETLKLTVTGVYGDTIWVNATPSSSHVLFRGGVDDTPVAADGKDSFVHFIDEDGKRTYAVRFNDTGSYTIKVTVVGGPRSGEYDTVDIAVSEKAVTFDVPSNVVIGSKFTIKGTANTGTYVDIAVDDVVYSDLNDLVIDANKQFSKEIDTSSSTGAGAAFQVPGSVRLKAFIDRHAGTGPIGPTEIDDGSVAILMVRGDLIAELSSTYVAWGDDFTISGKALGAKSVDIVIVSPKGSSGTKIDGTAKSVLPGCPERGQVGLYLASESVSEDNFSKKITVGENVDTGTYAIAVFSPGSDGVYGKTGEITLADCLCQYWIPGKTQSEMLAILEDITIESDDLLVLLYIKVDTPHVKLNPIASVRVGEPLVVTGTSNRPDGFAIVITVKGPKELTPQVAKVEKGVEHGNFSATFDTTGAPVGTYIVKADDGDGHTDEATVEILPLSDNIPPIVTIDEPHEDFLTNISTITVNGTISENATVKAYRNGICVNESVSVNVAYLTFNSTIELVEGLNNLTITATDAAKNTGSDTVNGTLDTIGPSFAITIEPNFNIKMANLTINATEPLIIELSVTIKRDGVPVDYNKKSWVPPTWLGNYSIAIDGNYTIRVNGTDLAGNVESGIAYSNVSHVSITKDTPTEIPAPPNTRITITLSTNVTDASITVTATKENPTNVTYDDTKPVGFIDITASPELETNVTNVNITMYYSESELPPDVDESTLRIYHSNKTSNKWEPLPGGVNIVENYVWGTINHLSLFGMFGKKDATPPETMIETGPTGTINSRDVTFTWSGSDDITLATQLVYSYILEGYETSWSAWISSTSKSYSGLPNGAYVFKVKAKDQAGNEGTPASRSFTVSIVEISRGGGGGGGGGAALLVPPNIPVDPTTGAVKSTTTLTVDGATLTIPAGTIVKDAEGKPLSRISYATITAESVGAIAAYDLGPSGATFAPPIDLVIRYESADIPEGFIESYLVIRMWDGTAWVDLDTDVDEGVNKAITKVSHFTLFALFAAQPVAPSPTAAPVETPTATPAPTPTPTPPLFRLPTLNIVVVVIIALVIVALIIAGAYRMLRRKT